MRAVIIANGTIENTSILKENILFDDTIICCDGGLNHVFTEGIIPHYALGDLDSAHSHIIDFYKTKGVKFTEYNTKKNETDLELCINFAISLGINELLILGAIGTRFDHTLTNTNLLVKALESNIKASIINQNNIIMLLDNNFNFDLNYVNYIGEDNIKTYVKKNSNISLIPLTSEVTGITTTGLEYHLNNHTMQIGNSLGVSNIILDDINFNIIIKTGYLLVMLVRD